MKNSFSKWRIVLFAGLFFLQACNTQMNSMVADYQVQSEVAPGFPSNPKPDHIVIVVMENHEYWQIMRSKEAPYINSFAKDTMAAIFTESYMVEHPSQPNYLNLFSGFNQGVTDDGHPAKEPFTTPNLGRQLIDAGKSFATYSEDLPAVGYNGDRYGAYFRKHNPAANWMGTGKNQIPISTNQPFTAFPADYTKLPTVSLVVPNVNNDMHDGSISTGDTWVRNNLDGYVQWAKTHNSLFILTFDEDDYGSTEHIITIFSGGMVKGGAYKVTINHFNVLRTIEWMYGLPYAGSAANVKTINNCWR
jgi:phosphatidylinositol-3-phosphatase